MSNDIAIKVNDVSKSFKLPHQKQNSIKGIFVNLFRGKRVYEKQEVLKNISFEVKKGEFFGIVGRNGSGKSTLLKLIAGIYSPNKGEISVSGKLTPFIELGVGFNPELTGRENVYLNGALFGFERKEVDLIYDDIVKFAELERFMDQKLKNYSSGMQVRLAFSIAIRAETEILVLDEVLAVGDASFQQKCFNYFEQIKRENKTIILVTHEMSIVKRFCTRAILIEKGIVKKQGEPKDIADQYLLDNMETAGASTIKEGEKEGKRKLMDPVSSFKITLDSNKNLKSEDILEFSVEYSLTKDLEVNLGYSVISDGFSIMEQNSKKITLPSIKNKNHKSKCFIPVSSFNPGKYSVDVAIFEKKGFGLIGYHIGAIEFIVTSDKQDKTKGGPMKTQGEWLAA